MLRNRLWMAFLAALSLVLVCPAQADPPEGKGRPDKAAKHAEKGGRGSGQGSGESESQTSGTALVSAGISAALARQHALESRIDFGNYKSLPPGIRKNLARGKPLPPGIAKQVAPNSLRSCAYSTVHWMQLVRLWMQLAAAHRRSSWNCCIW